jgi:hypothetical protein
MATKDCPHCGLSNPLEALRCDCGYDFISHEIEPPYYRPKPSKQGAMPPGTLVVVLSLVGMGVLGLCGLFVYLALACALRP